MESILFIFESFYVNYVSIILIFSDSLFLFDFYRWFGITLANTESLIIFPYFVSLYFLFCNLTVLYLQNNINLKHKFHNCKTLLKWMIFVFIYLINFILLFYVCEHWMT